MCGISLEFWKIYDISFRNQAVRQHISTTRGLFPHKRLIRRSEMTVKGLVVVEQEEDFSSPPATSSSPSAATTKIEDPVTPKGRSPVAELLYMRWLDGLRLKWPSIL